MALQEIELEQGDLISADGVPNKEDRGDLVEPELGLETLKELVKDAPKEKVETDEPKPQHIPKARFDEVINRKNELQAELAEANRVINSLTTTTPPAPVFNEDEKEKEYYDAMIDGDALKAASIRREINANLRSQAADEAEQRINQRQSGVDLQTASQQAVRDYPYLDTPEGSEAIELILASRDAKIGRGMTPGDALRSAVATIAPKFAPETDGTPGRGLTAEPLKTDNRSTVAIARGAADSTLQPPSIQTGVGNRATAGRVNVNDMTEEQFENLSPAEKKRLRGDE